ncbi:MAG: M55 family metallopeptidase [Kiritimatiellae bacterium]|nr:M55 family metallopeptidase [Kiritimatiellia bacterium]
MARRHKKGCKIFVETDLEGVSGIWRFAQTRDRTTPDYAQAREYLMGDIAALVRGLRAGGATTIVISDNHGGGDNLVPHLMEPGAVYSTGKPRPGRPGLDATCDGVVLLGFHAMKGTPDGVLNHTQSSKIEARYWYNGVESGEIAQTALLAGSFGVPVIMVTGDTATCREARRFLGRSIITVPTKRGLGREAAELYPFEQTRQAIFEGARRALAALPDCKPYRLKMPIKAKREWIEHVERPSETRVVVREATLRDLSRLTGF